MSDGPLMHEISPADTYQIDSDEYDSEQELDNLPDDEYDRLVEEAETGFSEDEVKEMTERLKEKGLITFLRDYLAPSENGEVASLRKLLLGFGIIPPAPLRYRPTPNVYLLPFTKLALSRILRRRERLSHLNTVPQAVDLLRNATNIIVLSGAGISTSCGIPDFRSANGLYAQLQAEGQYELDDPQQMFDIHYFREYPEVFYSFAKQIYPSNFTPSPCHRWIKLLEDRGVLLRNYTQNIDTLESLAGVTKVLQCHGSFATASCLRCKTRVPGQTIEPYIMASQIPYCGSCRQEREAELLAIKANKEERRKAGGKGKAKGWGSGSESEEDEVDEWGGGEPGIIKPDITFFGQALDSEFDECLFHDREKVDLLVIIGTSLKVAPVSEVLTHIPHSVPQIFINLTPVAHVQPDICLLGDADTIVTWLSHELGWDIPPPPAVACSPTAQSKLPVGEDVIKELPSLTVPPEEVVWLSGVGELKHMHLLSSRTEQAEMENRTMAKTESNESAVNVDEPSAEGDGDEGEGDISLNDDRPSKRSRVEEE